MIPEIVVTHIKRSALTVPLIHPFVVATAEMNVTPNVRFQATAVRSADGAQFYGVGESAPFPPITTETQSAILEAPHAQLPVRLRDKFDFDHWLLQCSAGPVFRSGIATAILDAWSRAAELPFWRLLLELVGLAAENTGEFSVITDITLPIAEPDHMARMAREHVAAGFRHLKIKAGKNLQDDLLRLDAVAWAVAGQGVALGVDANTGFSVEEACAYLQHADLMAIQLWNFEEPTRKYALDDQRLIRKIARGVPIVADESCQNSEDLRALIAADAADAINLKFVKHGGPLRTLELGLEARAAGLDLMVGCMVDTRLGISAMLHVVRALGGVRFVDLDTAFLLRDDPFAGGYRASGNHLVMLPGPGLTVSQINPSDWSTTTEPRRS